MKLFPAFAMTFSLIAITGFGSAPAAVATPLPKDDVTVSDSSDFDDSSSGRDNDTDPAFLTDKDLAQFAASSSKAVNGKPATKPNYASQMKLMESISYPMLKNGNVNPDSRAYGGRTRDAEDMYASYRSAREAARQSHFKAQSTMHAPRYTSWADCGAYVATVVKKTVDPHFPWLKTRNQKPYLDDKANGWKKVGSTTNYRPQDYKAGDVMITKGPGHIMFWVGDWKGQKEVVNDASYSSDDTKKAGRMPGFRKIVLKPGTDVNTGVKALVDRQSRAYDVYRFTGRVANPIGTTEWTKWDQGYLFDNKPDLVAVNSRSELMFYRGKNTAGNLNAPIRLGSGFTNHQIITPGDWNKDGFQDLIGVNNKTGVMSLYSGTGYGGMSKKQIGSGFSTIRDLTSVGDWDGDGNSDLIGVQKKTGNLIIWKGNGKGGFKAKQQLGSGFMNLRIASGGDYNGDRKPDLISWNDSTGAVNLHPGNGKGGFGKKVSLSGSNTKFKNVMIQSTGDVNRDGYSDFMVVDKKTGELRLHTGGKGVKKLDAGKKAGSGWSTVKSIS